MKEPPTGEELHKLAEIAKFGSLRELVNTRGQTYKKLKPDLDSFTEKDFVRLIQENPSIMLRPILTDGKAAVIGFKEPDYEAFIRRTIGVARDK